MYTRPDTLLSETLCQFAMLATSSLSTTPGETLEHALLNLKEGQGINDFDQHWRQPVPLQRCSTWRDRILLFSVAGAFPYELCKKKNKKGWVKRPGAKPLLWMCSEKVHRHNRFSSWPKFHHFIQLPPQSTHHHSVLKPQNGGLQHHVRSFTLIPIWCFI